MLPLYRIMELVVYALLNFLPYMFLALYPFRNSLRFSRPVTIVLAAVITLMTIGCAFSVTIFPSEHTWVFSAFSTISYIVFYFLSVRSHFGKTLFTLLILSNIANLIVVVSKCIEGFLAPHLALQPYR